MTIPELDANKADLLQKVNVLIALNKRLYSNMDIASPMFDHEKALTKEIALLWSQINQVVREKRAALQIS